MLTSISLRPLSGVVGLSLALSACAVGPAVPPPLSTEAEARVPPTRGSGPDVDIVPEDYQRRRRRYPRGKALVSLGTVDFHHRQIDPFGAIRLDDETTARVFRMEVESVRRSAGAGGSLEFTSVNDDLHRGAPGISSSDTDSVDLYVHATVRPVARMFRIPIRIGPFIHMLDQETNGSDPDDIDYFSLGVRFEIEPEVDIVRTPDHAFSLFFNGNAQAGATSIDYRTQQFDEDFHTSTWGVGFRAGVRMQIRRFHMQAAYIYNEQTFEESDEELVGNSFLTLDEAEFMREGFLVSMGVRW